LPTLRRANPPSPGRPHHLRPRNEGAGGAPGGALPFTVALVRRDATLARRGPSRATGTPPLGAPPWRCRPRNRSGPALRIRPEGCSRPAIAHGGLRHRAFRSRAYRRGRRHSPLRLLDRLRRRPSRARMANLYYNFDMKSIYNANCSRNGMVRRPSQGFCADSDGDRELLSPPQLGITKDFRRQANVAATFLDI